MLRRTLSLAFPIWLAVLAANPAISAPVFDLDGDGLSDIWQIAFDAQELLPDGDEDGDGFSNLEECEHGTDPWDAASKFEMNGVEARADGVEFRFQGVRGQIYGIEESSDLLRWNRASDFVLSEGGEDSLVVPRKDDSVRFVRFRIGGDRDGDGLADFDESLLGYNPLNQHSSGNFLGGDMARLTRDFFSEGTFEVAGKQVAGTAPTLAEASRFLTQASLSSKMADIESVASMGYDAWLEEQFTQPAGKVLPGVWGWYEWYRLNDPENNPFNVHRRYAWWEQILTSNDLLRQRMAVALSEIYVVSDSALDGGAALEGMADYHDMLLDHSFGNARDILKDVSLHPVMGEYLSHMQNRKGDEAGTRFPDENYAREVMQLFSIGLFELNPDGSRKQDENGYDIPTYDNDDITNFARVFTGFAWGGENKDTNDIFKFLFPTWSDYVWDAPMKAWLEEHDTAEKTLLRGTVLPAFEDDPGRTPMDDLEDAIDNLFEHPNMGPFICYRLIQRLIKSNPSPGYVERVGRVFADNGQGVRGDMRSVIRAILLDVEARSLAAYDDPHAGRLREPYLRWVRLVTSFSHRVDWGDSDYAIPDWGHLDEMGQRWMSSNSVFNFFLPDYVPPGEMADAGLVGPEFEIFNAATAMATQRIFGNSMMWGFANWDDECGCPSHVFTLEEEAALLAADDLEGLIERLNIILCHGTLREDTQQLLRDVYESFPGWIKNNDRLAASALIRIVILSPEFAITM